VKQMPWSVYLLRCVNKRSIFRNLLSLPVLGRLPNSVATNFRRYVFWKFLLNALR
jgi:hypothetical protein